MSNVTHYARRTMDILNAIGAGFMVAFLGAPNPTIDVVGDDAPSFRKSAQPSPRVILVTDNARPATGAPAGKMGWTGTLTLDTMGITLPVVVVDPEGMPARFSRGRRGYPQGHAA